MRARINKSGFYIGKRPQKSKVEIYIRNSPISFRESVFGNARDGGNPVSSLFGKQINLFKGDISLYNFTS